MRIAKRSRLRPLICFFKGHKWYESNGFCDRCGRVCNHKGQLCVCGICGNRSKVAHDWNHCRCRRCMVQRDECHLWDGCRCTICGSTRDEGHLWSGWRCTKCHVRNLKAVPANLLLDELYLEDVFCEGEEKTSRDVVYIPPSPGHGAQTAVITRNSRDSGWATPHLRPIAGEEILRRLSEGQLDLYSELGRRFSIPRRWVETFVMMGDSPKEYVTAVMRGDYSRRALMEMDRFHDRSVSPDEWVAIVEAVRGAILSDQSPSILPLLMRHGVTHGAAYVLLNLVRALCRLDAATQSTLMEQLRANPCAFLMGMTDHGGPNILDLMCLSGLIDTHTLLRGLKV
jgi:hypothetical protein